VAKLGKAGRPVTAALAMPGWRLRLLGNISLSPDALTRQSALDNSTLRGTGQALVRASHSGHRHQRWPEWGDLAHLLKARALARGSTPGRY
jgi:hypothetical protein